MLRYVVVLFSWALLASCEPAEPPKDGELNRVFDAKAAQEAVREYAQLLENMYVDPKIGREYANLLRKKLSEGAYSSFPTPEAFAAAVPLDLRKIHPDLHLSILPASTPKTGVISDVSYPGGTCPPVGKQLVRSIGRSGWIAPETAYIEFCGFQGGAENVAQVSDFLVKHGSAKTLIIDNRGNIGGGHDEMNFMFPYFYKRMQELVRIEMRTEVAEGEANPMKGDAKMRALPVSGASQFAYIVEPDPRLRTGLQTAKIFVLTSKFTASAGESASFALKHTRRATLIGEKTRGAGHLGPTMPLAGGYRAFIPVARLFDAETGQGWERVGVMPHLEVPADQALDRALSEANIPAKEAKKTWAALQSAQQQR